MNRLVAWTMRSYRRTIQSGLMTACLVAAWAATAANMPVFRHALEQWPASDYEAVVFHRGELDGDDQSLVDKLRIARGQSYANLSVKTVDVAGQMDDAMEDLWTGQTNPAPPWLVVRAPDSSPDASPVWSGHFTESIAEALLDSPARRKIAEELLRGATAVWVLLESGEAARDEAAVDTLAAELKRLEKKLALPQLAPDDAKPRSPLPLAIGFSLVRVTRTDPAEEFFVTLLQHGRQLFAARPAAIPIYGRGRALGTLVGREIDAESIEQACASIVASARDAKEQSPGRDLLLAANWKSIFDPAAAVNRAASAPAPAAATTPGTPVAQTVATEQTRWLVYLVPGIALMALIAFVFLRPGRGSR